VDGVVRDDAAVPELADDLVDISSVVYDDIWGHREGLILLGAIVVGLCAS
jgi:hypothetical protein